MPLHAHPLLQALQWHAQGQYGKAWTLYARLASSQRQHPLYWLALTLLSLQKGEQHLTPQYLQHFQDRAPSTAEQWQCWHRLPLALWAEGLGHWRKMDQALLLSMNEYRPSAGVHPYFDFLLTLLLCPTAQATAAARSMTKSPPPTEAWGTLAQAEAWCYLRHQHMRSHPQALTGMIALLQQEIAVQLQPVPRANALDLLARLSLIQGDLSTAQGAFAEAVNGDPTPLRQLQQALCHLPLQGNATTEQWQELKAQLQRFTERNAPIPITHVVTEARNGLFTLFDWNYAHAQDAQLRQLHGQCFAGVASLNPSLALSRPEKQPSGGLGIVVTPGQEGMFYFSHQTLLAPLSHEISVHLLVFAPHAVWDDLQRQAPRLQIHYLSGEFGNSYAGAGFIKQWEAVRQWGLQWVYYWEVGTDTLSFLIPYFRLAPVQFTAWGSVSSTGHPAIDAFLTTALLSPPGPDTDALFNERCVYFPQLPVGFFPDMLLSPPQRLEGLDEKPPNHCRIGCLHTPRKNSPEFLAALQAILSLHRQNHPHITVEVVMIESPNRLWQQAFALAVTEALGAEAAAVTWLPRQTPDAFIEQLQRMDFLLDAFPFGGGKLAYDSLLCGVPLVSLKGTQLRGRIPFASYTELQIYDVDFTAPTDVESYISQACDLIHQPALRSDICQRILKGRERLVHRPLTEDFLNALQTMLRLKSAS